MYDDFCVTCACLPLCLVFPNPNCEVLLITVLVLNVFLDMVTGYVSAHLCKSTVEEQHANNSFPLSWNYAWYLFDLKLVLWSYLQLQLFCS